MSDLLTIKLSPTHGIIAALIFLGGGGAFAVSRRNSGRTTEADPEAIELVVRDTVEDGVTMEASVAIDADVEADVGMEAGVAADAST